MSDQALMDELRGLMAQEPSTGTFQRIAERLGNGDVSASVLEYLEPELAKWPETIKRKAPWEWVSRTCRGWKAPALCLANHIDASWHTFKTKQAVALFASPSVRNLRWFRNDPKRKTDPGNEGIVAIATSPHLKNLVDLYVWTFAEDEAIVTLIASTNLPRLRRLWLMGTWQSVSMVEALEQAPMMETLSSFHFYHGKRVKSVSEARHDALKEKVNANYARYQAEEGDADA